MASASGELEMAGMMTEGGREGARNGFKCSTGGRTDVFIDVTSV